MEKVRLRLPFKDEDFAQEIVAFYHYMRRCVQQWGDEQLTSTQALLLLFLSEHEGMHAKDAAQYFGLDKSSMSQLLHSLYRKGFVTFEPMPSDKRLKLILLTDRGEDYVQFFKEKLIKWSHHILDSATTEQRNAIGVGLGYINQLNWSADFHKHSEEPTESKSGEPMSLDMMSYHVLFSDDL